MNEIIKILVKRDGITAEEAKEQVKEAIAEVKAAINRGEDCETVWDIWANEVGLEPDYLLDAGVLL